MLFNNTIKAVASILLMTIMLSGGYSHATTGTDSEPVTSNYVVIGAFSFVKNAERFAEYANSEKSLTAQFAMNPLRNLYYVYVLSTEDLQEAIEVVKTVRADHPELWDAWVFTGSLGALEENEINSPEITEIAEEIPASEEPEEEIVEPETPLLSTIEVEKPEEIVPEAVESVSLEPKEGYNYFYFNTINKKTMKEVKGRMRVIDAERHKEMDLAESLELVEVRDPNNGTNRIKVATQIFGFKEVEHTIDLDQPVTDSTAMFADMIGDSIVLDFELERFKKGDVLVMYNVYFFKDAAVMKPESQYELLSLLDMLQENKKLQVRIHGHTNGNAKGKIVHLDPEEKNFFSLRAEQEEDFGSARQLSEFRAETIEQWLIEQGVEEGRMSTKGWGGKKMIYDKHDTQAHKNVRVEIEIVED